MVRLVRHWPEARTPMAWIMVQCNINACDAQNREAKEKRLRSQSFILLQRQCIWFPLLLPMDLSAPPSMARSRFSGPIDEVARSTIREYMLQTCRGEFRLGSRSQATERKPSCPLPSTPRTLSPRPDCC